MADICAATSHVRFTPNSDRESGHAAMVMSALLLKADMCGARGHVRFGPIADISQLSAGLSINPNWRPGTSAFGLKAAIGCLEE
jgi:hypothetical protein